MQAKELSDLFISVLSREFPEFVQYLEFLPNDITVLNIKSPHKRLTLRILTAENEITLGFALGNKFGWHTHMDVLGAKSPNEEILIAIEWMCRILNDEVLISCIDKKEYFITNDFESLIKNKLENETVETLHWTEL